MVLLIAFLFILFVGGLIAVLGWASGRTSSDTPRSFLSIVPRPAKIIAVSLLSIAVTIAVTVGSLRIHAPNGHPAWAIGGIFGLLGGSFVGGLFMVWVLCLGYVYGDARRRNMPAVPWTLVAFFVPNLLGFLLYFVLRKPLGSPCPNCGQSLTPDQRFCSWCGNQQYAAPGNLQPARAPDAGV